MKIMGLFENKLKFFTKNTFVALSIIIIISLMLRFYYYIPQFPLTADALEYFFYASDSAIQGQLPVNYSPANNGWPAFLAIVFSVFDFESTATYMDLQRIVSIIISVITIIPVFILCKKFFSTSYSLLGAAIFGLEPRLVQNSLLGITEPLYILLGCVSLLSFLSSNQKMVYVSFGLAGLASLVRSEGLFLFFGLTVLFFIKNRGGRLAIPKYIIALGIFLLIVLPMATYRIESAGYDALFMRISDTATTISTESQNGETTIFSRIFTGLENYPKYLGWNLIPVFILFVPPGFILLVRKLTTERMVLLVLLISMSMPAFYAYSTPIPETRYFYFLYPIFCVLSLFTVEKITTFFSQHRFVLIIIGIGVICASITFLEYQMTPEEDEKNAFLAAQLVSKYASGVNQYYPEDRYLEATTVPDKWSDFELLFKNERRDGVPVIETVPGKITTISTNGFDSLPDYIKYAKEKGLTHLVIDGKPPRSQFLNDIFHHEGQYPYLTKEFDASKEDYEFPLKIFKIDYDKFETIENKN